RLAPRPPATLRHVPADAPPRVRRHADALNAGATSRRPARPIGYDADARSPGHLGLVRDRRGETRPAHHDPRGVPGRSPGADRSALRREGARRLEPAALT